MTFENISNDKNIVKMMIKIIWCLLTLAFVTTAQSKYIPLAILADQKVIAHRSCMQVRLGYDKIYSALEKMVQQYIDTYNDRWEGHKPTVLG
jgi:hypothetical protein